jgi:MtN3 and saliva related transmembrane protein
MAGEMTELLGFLAATLTTAAFVPQVIKTWRTRSAGDLSLGMLAVFGTGIMLWLAYGLSIGAAPIVIGNIVTLVLTAILIGLKLHF